MDKSIIYLIVFLAGLICAAIPYGVFMGLAKQFEIKEPESPYLTTILYIATIFISYVASIGSFAAIQNQSCGQIKNMNQIAGNAALSTVIVVLILTLAVFIPFLRNIVLGIFPPSFDPFISAAMSYSYFLFWGALYGFTTGGYMAANCGQT